MITELSSLLALQVFLESPRGNDPGPRNIQWTVDKQALWSGTTIPPVAGAKSAPAHGVRYCLILAGRQLDLQPRFPAGQFSWSHCVAIGGVEGPLLVGKPPRARAGGDEDLVAKSGGEDVSTALDFLKGRTADAEAGGELGAAKVERLPQGG